ncbi:MAG: hypothetical protein LLG40_12085 [Deltaproteobacteria bacterium]|nr:hypothetical protein [Deltaproteobacteria bacterium]
MRKVQYCLLVFAAAVIVISCSGKDGPDLATINPGLYEINFDIKYGGQLIILKQRVRYNSAGMFEATNFQNNAALEEIRGKFKIDNGQLISYDTQHRLITQEGEWQNRGGSSVPIRKIKKNSYQYYFKFPNEQAQEKYKGLGLSEGWKTYKRISD